MEDGMTIDNSDEFKAMLEECYATAATDRNKLAAFYDVRLVLDSYLALTAQLIAATLAHKLYTEEEILGRVAEFVEAAMKYDSKSVCIRKHGDDVIEGGKQ
jgi:hypothetical protein